MALQNLFKSAFSLDSEEFKAPMIFAIILVNIATIVPGLFQHAYNAPKNAIIGVSIVMVLHSLVLWFSDKIFKHRYWLYFGIQGIIVFNYSVIMPQGFETILIGLIPVLIFQCIMVYYDTYKVVLTSVYFYAIFGGTIFINDGEQGLIKYIPVFIVISLAVRLYSILFLKQVKVRINTQKILRELELAYEKVEELTLVNERQRMARDLHDTLSQGLAGIIMQLEAINANLNNNNTKRAQEIVQKSMEHARRTLSDSRLVIDDLRFQETSDIDFIEALEKEIAQFKAISNILIKTDIRVKSELPVNLSKHIIYIIRESINNIAKHSKAKNAAVEIIQANNYINISVIDDGIGFDVKLLDRMFGHYGILGMTERVEAINGKIKIKSIRKSGTDINIIIPIEKGFNDEDEYEKNINSR